MSHTADPKEWAIGHAEAIIIQIPELTNRRGSPINVSIDGRAPSGGALDTVSRGSNRLLLHDARVSNNHRARNRTRRHGMHNLLMH